MSNAHWFTGIRPVSAQEWKMALQAGLKGGDYNTLLTSELLEGIRIKPFYTQEDLPGDTLSTLSNAIPWKIGSHMDAAGSKLAFHIPNVKHAGVDRWIISLPENTTNWPDWFYTQPPWPESLQIVPANPFEFPYKNRPPEIVGKTEVLLDPIGQFAHTGSWIKNMQYDLATLEQTAEAIRAAGLIPRILIRVEIYQQSGANAIQEIAYALAHMHEYLQCVTDYKKRFSEIQKPIFQMTLGGEYFTDIAKVRAIRTAWNLLANVYELSPDCEIQVQPSLRNKTKFDFNTNLLRSTMECMAGCIGGADLICNLPYDAPFKEPNSFSDRLAQNQLLVLKYESGLGQDSDLAAGSYYLESLTHQLGKKAIALFKSMIQGGGLIAQLKSHTVQKKIKESARREQEHFNAGTRVLVGSNFQPNPDEQITPERTPSKPHRTGIKTEIEPLPLRRLAQAHELNRQQHAPR